MIYLITYYILTIFFNAAAAGYDTNAIIPGNDFFDEKFEGHLKYSDCHGSESSIKLEKFGTYPSTEYNVPGNVSMSVGFSVLKTLGGPIKIDLTVSKEIPLLGYTTLPCMGNYGSCTFEQVCHIWDTYPKDSFQYQISCPKWLKASGVKCKCPFEKGRYNAEDVMVAVGNSIVPKWIAAGDYKVTVKIIEGEKMAGCFKFQFRLK